MKTRYKFIHFTPEGVMWFARNNKTSDPLAVLEYYAPWKQWVLSAVAKSSVFSADCLTDIAHFMGQLKGEKP